MADLIPIKHYAIYDNMATSTKNTMLSNMALELHCKKSIKNSSKALTTYKSNSRRRKRKIKQTMSTKLCRNEINKFHLSVVLRQFSYTSYVIPGLANRKSVNKKQNNQRSTCLSRKPIQLRSSTIEYQSERENILATFSNSSFHDDCSRKWLLVFSHILGLILVHYKVL